MGILPDDVLNKLHGSLTAEQALAIQERAKLVDPAQVDAAIADLRAAVAARAAGAALVDTLLAVGAAALKMGLQLAV